MVLFRSQSAAHGGEPVSTFQAWGLAHKGKATAPGLVFNLADGPDAYTNPLVHQKLTSYVEGVREVHGPEYDPTTEPIDADIIMRVGGGKKHGRHLIADSSITGSRRLSQIRAESTSGSLPIRERPTATQHIVSSLQSQLAEERRAREESERAAAERERERERAFAERLLERERAFAERERSLQENMASIERYLQAQAEALNRPPPPHLVFIPPQLPPEPQQTPIQSAASNDSVHGATPPPTLPAPQTYPWPHVYYDAAAPPGGLQPPPIVPYPPPGGPPLGAPSPYGSQITWPPAGPYRPPGGPPLRPPPR